MFESRSAVVADAARGLVRRFLGWVVGTILGVAGAVTAIWDFAHHHHGVGAYLFAAGAFILFAMALDMWRVERGRRRGADEKVTQLGDRVAVLEDEVRHLSHDRDEWRRLHAELQQDMWKRGASPPETSNPPATTTVQPSPVVFISSTRPRRKEGADEDQG